MAFEITCESEARAEELALESAKSMVKEPEFCVCGVLERTGEES
jgi:hypothetical protein